MFNAFTQLVKEGRLLNYKLLSVRKPSHVFDLFYEGTYSLINIEYSELFKYVVLFNNLKENLIYQ